MLQSYAHESTDTDTAACPHTNAEADCLHRQAEYFLHRVIQEAIPRKTCALWFTEDVGLDYLFFKVADVAQIKSDCFDHCEEDHPCYEQSLIVTWQVIELQIKQNNVSNSSVNVQIRMSNIF